MRKKENKFWKEQVIERLRKGYFSPFLNTKQFHEIEKYLKRSHISYQVWECFHESDYKIIYTKRKPMVTAFIIHSVNPLTHSQVMGSLYSLNLDEGYFGDIIVGENVYIFVLSSMANYIKQSLIMIGKERVELEKVSPTSIEYERSFEAISFSVSSPRIDVIVSKIMYTSRTKVKEVITKEEVMINYEVCDTSAYNLKIGDVFSIRKFGKYIVSEMTKNRKGNLIIQLKRYL